MPTTGTETMTISTSQGTVTAQLDAANAPCTTASFTYLASKNFFDNTTCHRPDHRPASYVLQCGDPTGTGSGGPAYTFADENLPVDFAARPARARVECRRAGAAATPRR